MKTALLTLLLSFTTQYLLAQKDTVVPYIPKGLQWSHFKGAIKEDTLIVAAISSAMNIDVRKISIWDGRISFRCYAVMYPNRSWVKPAFKDAYTLQHEQTHFDISESCARAMEAELNNLKICSLKSPLIITTFNKWESRRNELQMQYDKETKGGNDTTEQNSWTSKISAELDIRKQYTDT